MPPVAIIGAGPAGSAAAILLSRAGVAVRIFEARPFPRAKVCGEFISPSAAPEVDLLGLGPVLESSGARPVRSFLLSVGDRTLDWPLPVHGRAISRERLDTVLLARAAKTGAEVVQPGPVRTVEYGPQGVVVVLSDGARHAADIVIHADGSGRHDPAGPIPHDPGMVAAKCYFGPDVSQPAGVAIRACQSAYIGTMPIENGQATCALAVKRGLVRDHRGDFEQVLTSLWPGRGWRASSAWLACPLARSGYRSPGHPRSFRIGNAAAAVDPVGGEGISNALWSGARLAQLLIEVPTLSDAHLRQIQSRFAREYRGRLRMRGPVCRAAAAILERPRLVSALWPLVQVPSLTLWPWYRLTGKPA